MKKLHWLAIALIALIIACGQNTKQNENSEVNGDSSETQTIDVPDKVRLDEGKQTAQSFQAALLSELGRALENGGVANAINYCNLQALPITDSISKMHGVQISRVSHKYRNPNNAASTFEQELIRRYQKDITAGVDVKPTLEGELFYAPIAIKMPLCLSCHGVPGEDITPEDFILINAVYPNDNATHFKMGDVRGLLKIDFNADTAAAAL